MNPVININTALIENVKGFLDEEEGAGLYEYALEIRNLGPCLEIGGYCGKSTLYLGSACKETNNLLFSIDHHQGSEEHQPGEAYFDPDLFDVTSFRINTFTTFRQTIRTAELEMVVIPIVCQSHIVARCWTTPLGLVFIDGGHAYETVFTDYNAWFRHILPGGFLLIHDIFKDPEKGGQAPYEIYQLALASGMFKKLPIIKTLGILQRLKIHEYPDHFTAF